MRGKILICSEASRRAWLMYKMLRCVGHDSLLLRGDKTSRSCERVMKRPGAESSADTLCMSYLAVEVHDLDPSVPTRSPLSQGLNQASESQIACGQERDITVARPIVHQMVHEVQRFEILAKAAQCLQALDAADGAISDLRAHYESNSPLDEAVPLHFEVSFAFASIVRGANSGRGERLSHFEGLRSMNIELRKGSIARSTQPSAEAGVPHCVAGVVPEEAMCISVCSRWKES